MIHTEPCTDVGLLRSSLLDALGVPHAFTTRAGGVSRGVFASLNFGNPMDLAVGDRDPAANIAENFRRLLAAVGAPHREVVQVYQVHGAAVRVFRAGDPSRDRNAQGPLDFKADALVTDDPSRLLAVRVADCTPVLLASADGRVVAAVHAGWRGVVAGVAPAAVGAMRALGAVDLRAAVGPCISAAHFEIGPEVLAAFRDAFGDAAPVRADPARPGKGFADLKAALAWQLAAAGVGHVDVLPHCTFADPGRFFSHRRDKGRTGRMVGLIGPRA